MRRIIMAVLALAIMLGLAVTVSPAAVADIKQACVQELGISQPTARDARVETPTVLVHGLWSDKNAWSKAGLTTALAGINGLAVVEPFDYESANDRWVTEGNTAHRLAATIVCYSKLYDGKPVVIVAHSMGGLLVRAALSQAAYGTFAKKVTGHIVTIGTPHKGADISDVSYTANISLCNAAFFWWGKGARENCSAIEASKAVSAMRPSSAELAALPRFPSNISVEAIAGEVKRKICSPWSCSEDSTGGDLVVPVASATDEFTTTGIGDGKKIFACTAVLALPQASHPWCEHSAMLQASWVQSEVKASIQAYLTSLKPEVVTKLPLPPYHMESEFFTRLKVPYLDIWGGAMSEPGAVMNIVDNTSCGDSNAACPHINIIDLDSEYGHQTYGDNPVGDVAAAASCPTTGGRPDSAMKPTATRYVGGTSAEYYEQVLCSSAAGQFKGYVWYVKSHHLLVTASDTPAGKISLPGLRASLDNVEWVPAT